MQDCEQIGVEIFLEALDFMKISKTVLVNLQGTVRKACLVTKLAVIGLSKNFS